MTNLIHSDTEALDYLNSIRDGSFRLGLGIDCKLDEHLRYKTGQITVMAGHANVGKTLSIIYYFTLLAHKHGLKFAILSTENTLGAIKNDILTLYTRKKLSLLKTEEFEFAHYWLTEHFKFINFEKFFEEKNKLMSFKDAVDIVDDLEMEGFRANSIVLDPYNSLGMDERMSANRHEYDYAVMAHLRIWARQTKRSVYIMAHGVTDALRKTHSKGEHFEGYTRPLLAADIEGGGKFVNRCDDFVVIHRYIDHESEWTKTEWHVKKVKDTKTGGRPTFRDKPVILQAQNNLTGFRVFLREEPFAEPLNWTDPMEGKDYELRDAKPLPVNKNFYEKE